MSKPNPSTVWQITGSGVRAVVIVHAAGATDQVRVSRIIAIDSDKGPAFGYRPLTSASRLDDLFLREADARLEFCRRRRMTHASTDRRRRAPSPTESAPHS